MIKDGGDEEVELKTSTWKEKGRKSIKIEKKNKARGERD